MQGILSNPAWVDTLKLNDYGIDQKKVIEMASWCADEMLIERMKQK